MTYQDRFLVRLFWLREGKKVEIPVTLHPGA